MPDSVRAGVGRTAAQPWLALGVLVFAAVFGPLAAGMGLEVERPELATGLDLAIFLILRRSDRVKVLGRPPLCFG